MIADVELGSEDSGEPFPNAPVRGVIFDMDGVLLDTERISRIAWKQAAKEFGYELSDEVFALLLGRAPEGGNAILRCEFGSDFPVFEVRNRRAFLRAEYIESNGIPVKEGVRGFVEFLTRLSIPFAVATSTSTEEARSRLKIAGIGRYFDVIIGGEMVQHGKPAPDIFLRAAERLGVEPNGCVVIEDSEAGIMAAHAAGMRVIVIPDLKEPSEEARGLSWAVCRSFNEAKGIFREV